MVSVRRILCFAMHTVSLEGVKLETGRINAREARAVPMLALDSSRYRSDGLHTTEMTVDS